MRTICVMLAWVNLFGLRYVLFERTNYRLVDSYRDFFVVAASRAIVLRFRKVGVHLRRSRVLAIKLVARSAYVRRVGVQVRLGSYVLFTRYLAPMERVPLIRILQFRVLGLLAAMWVRVWVLFIDHRLRASQVELSGLDVLGAFLGVVCRCIVRRADFTILVLRVRVVAVCFVMRRAFEGVRFKEFLLRKGGRDPWFYLNF